MLYHFKIHKEGTGFWAQCLELPGCFTQGDSITELKNNMHEALHFYLSEPTKDLYPEFSIDEIVCQ